MAACGRPPEEPLVDEHIDDQKRAFEETKGQGVWAKKREDPDRRRLAEKLFALGYLDGMRPAAGAQDGVVTYDAARAWNGLNLYVAGHGEQADLIDMQGRVLHSWTFDLKSAWLPFPKGDSMSGLYFRRASLLPNGDLMVLYDHRALLRLDKDSHLLWAYTKRPHHDFEVFPDGSVTVLTAEVRIYPPWHEKARVVDNSIVRLDPNGNEVGRTSILEAVEHSTVPRLWGELKNVYPTKMGKLGDVLHANSVQTIDATLTKRVPLLKPGHVIVSLPLIHRVVVVDPKTGRAYWAFQGSFRFQHHAKLLPTGHLLLFDNQRGDDEQSAIQEIDPLTNRVTWTYRGTPEHPFFSWCCGTTYRLPNGNTLIVETEGGRAFEVTSAGETVWEFQNPHRAGEKQDLIAQMFDLIRIDPATTRSWLGDP